jgi:acetaldehyde dehydrogenase (acetylating)
MHTQDRAAAIKYGEQMPAARVIINSPTTHGAIGFSTGLSPSMTLGCGSWGGNVTSDNVSPLHLIDLKRVAFETKPVNRGLASPTHGKGPQAIPAAPRRSIGREEIASIVDSFLNRKLAERPLPEPPSSEVASPVRTIVHKLIAEPPAADSRPAAREFVSEDDVRQAIRKGEKIYISKRTILTPSARDLGEEKDVIVQL